MAASYSSQPPPLALVGESCTACLEPLEVLGSPDQRPPWNRRSGAPEHAGDKARQGRLRHIIQDQIAFVWRSLRRLGIPPRDLDDAAQEIFVVASRRLDDIEEGHERGFLFKTCVHYASRAYRGRIRRGRVESDGVAVEDVADPRPGPDALADQSRAKQLCYELLGSMDIDLRAVFVLYEIERFTMAEIADTLEVPMGTVASRLRRARQTFFALVHRTVASRRQGGGS